MIKSQSLTAEARIGHLGNENPHLWSSPSWYAHALGSYLHGSGRSMPTDVRMGRGDSIRSGDMRFSFKHTGKHIHFIREE